MQNETKFKVKVMAELRKIPKTWVTKIQQVSIRGTPDLLICHRGMFFAWELKGGKPLATPLQAHVIGQINEAGGRAHVVTPENLETSLEFMQSIGRRAAASFVS